LLELRLAGERGRRVTKTHWSKVVERILLWFQLRITKFEIWEVEEFLLFRFKFVLRNLWLDWFFNNHWLRLLVNNRSFNWSWSVKHNTSKTVLRSSLDVWEIKRIEKIMLRRRVVDYFEQWFLLFLRFIKTERIVVFNYRWLFWVEIKFKRIFGYRFLDFRNWLLIKSKRIFLFRALYLGTSGFLNNIKKALWLRISFRWKVINWFWVHVLLCLFDWVPPIAISTIKLVDWLWLRFIPIIVIPLRLRIISIIVFLRRSILPKRSLCARERVHVRERHPIYSQLILIPMHSYIQSMFSNCKRILKRNPKSNVIYSYNCLSNTVRPSLMIFFFPDRIESTNSIEWIWESSEIFQT